MGICSGWLREGSVCADGVRRVAFSNVGAEPGVWEEARSPGPLITIRAGGPLDGVVTVTAIVVGRRRILVEASWTQDERPHSESLEAPTLRIARAIANAAANQLAVGNRPTLSPD